MDESLRLDAIRCSFLLNTFILDLSTASKLPYGKASKTNYKELFISIRRLKITSIILTLDKVKETFEIFSSPIQLPKAQIQY